MFKQRSFTLIELLVVIAIVGVLAALVMPSINNARTKARDAKRLEDLRQFSSALEMYYSDNNHYPVWEEGGGFQDESASTTLAASLVPKYLASLPKDPLPSKYVYYYQSDATGSLYKGAAYMETSSGQQEKAATDGGTASKYYEAFSFKGADQIDFSGNPNDDDSDFLDSEMPDYVFACGDPITFTYRGSLNTYGTVSHNDRCWLDRNLGASQKATAYNDSAAYGDLFQWGRLDDNHQDCGSGTTSELSSSDNPGHSNFIMPSGSPYDWRSPQNNNLWQGVNGINNPCPEGWRVPTKTEWEVERLSWVPNSYNGAFASPLKLTVAGRRINNSGSLNNVGSVGYYWTSTFWDTPAWNLDFGDVTNMNGHSRSYGLSVRCIKD